MAIERIEITTEAGERVIAMAPFVVSASRSTDLPAFYSDWFMRRLGDKEHGYAVWYNPFNQKPVYVSFAKTKVIVFWSKNPKPLMKHLNRLDELGIHYYFQFTVNDYEAEGFERNVPSLEKRIETFKALSDRVGPGRVIWRFDPLIFTPQLTPRVLATRIFNLSKALKGYTDKLVFSFIDVSEYRKVQNNLLKYSETLASEYTKDTIQNVQATVEQIEEFCGYMQKMKEYWKTKDWDLTLATCAEGADLASFGIEHNKCIDDALIAREFADDPEVAEFLKPKKRRGSKPAEFDLFGEAPAEPRKVIPITETSMKKDAGQRKECGCVESKDIGMYNTCVHGCIYCYANTTMELAKKNLKRHHDNPHAESIWAGE
jgi:DNA repair photolyase